MIITKICAINLIVEIEVLISNIGNILAFNILTLLLINQQSRITNQLGPLKNFIITKKSLSCNILTFNIDIKNNEFRFCTVMT